MHIEQPSLPSIHHLLPSKLNPQPLRLGHRNTKSVSSLPTELQSLSMQRPTSPMVNNSALLTTTPSWMFSDTSPPLSSSSSSTSSSSSKHISSNLDSLPVVNKSKDHRRTVSATAMDNTSTRYLCPYCPKRFSRPSSLRIHTYSHTGEKPFICTELGCGRRFSVQSNMRRHIRIHRSLSEFDK